VSSQTLPVPTPDSARFWAGCAAGELWLPRCSVCGQLNWFPRAMCRYCSSTTLEWEQLGGGGSVYSFTVVERPAADDLPPGYVLALVDLDEGVRMMTHIVGAEPATIRVGMPVVVDFQPANEEIALPVFKPRE
jgi:uncharacterized OB-fold protein